MTLDSFFEQSYLPGANTGNTLTIHLSVNQLVLSVKNKEGELLGLKQYFLQENFFSEKGVNELADLFSAISTLSGTFSDVRVCIDTPYFMPIPHNFSDSEDNIKWLQHQFKIGSNFWVGTYNYPQLEASVIYAVPLLLYNSLLARFPSARYYSSGALLPEMYLNNYTEHQQTLVGLINHTHFYASVFIKGKLQLLNSYEINTDEDFMYFILNLMDKLQLSQNDCKVFLGGLIYDSDNKWQQLKKYIAHLNLMEINNKDISNGQVYFTNLFLHQCE